MSKNKSESKLLSHPMHPIFTHFPMALWTISLLWDLLGFMRGDSLWWSFSKWSIAAGLIFAFLAIITGLVDFGRVPKEGPSETIAMKHMLLVISASIFYGGSFFFRLSSLIPTGYHFIFAESLSVIGFLLLLIGGWYGGELVYRHGIGRRNSDS